MNKNTKSSDIYNINLLDFIEDNGKESFEVSLSELDKRVTSHGFLCSDDKDNTAVKIKIDILARFDTFKRPLLDINIHAELNLVCQFCLKPLKFILEDHTGLTVFSNENELDQACDVDIDIEGIVVEGEEINILTIIEDQILLAIPFSPRHESCENQYLEKINQDKPNPFIKLKTLKLKDQ